MPKAKINITSRLNQLERMEFEPEDERWRLNKSQDSLINQFLDLSNEEKRSEKGKKLKVVMEKNNERALHLRNYEDALKMAQVYLKRFRDV